MYSTPILVIIFNRPDFAIKMHHALSQVKPKKLYVISDGPRTSREKEEVLKSREIFDSINWECEVKYNYSDVNLGLRKRISGGISWAFQTEEKLIILEDDCIPHPDFFSFCEKLLTKYQDDERIMNINGCNLNPTISKNYSDSYFFSRYSSSWGWATWKRAWKLYDSELSGLENKDVLKNFADNLPSRYRSGAYWLYMLKQVKSLKIDSWSYRWMFTLWVNNGLAIVPQTNLIQNIGNDKRSSNTKGNLHYLNISTSLLNLNNSWDKNFVVANRAYDEWLEDTIYSKSSLNRSIWMLKKFISILFSHYLNR